MAKLIHISSLTRFDVPSCTSSTRLYFELLPVCLSSPSRPAKAWANVGFAGQLTMRSLSLIGTVALALVVQVLQGCGAKIEKSVDKAIVDASIDSALYFDLEESPNVSAALVVRSNSNQAELRAAVLPFSTSPLADGDHSLLATWGSHEGITLITYVAAPSLPATAMIPVKPIYESGQESDFLRTDLQGSLYFMNSGLKRRFLYQWPQPKNLSTDSWKKLGAIAHSSIDSVLIKLPKEAEIFERSVSSLAPVVERDAPTGRLKVYPHTKPDSAALSPIDIAYQVPPTKLQNQIFEYTLKLFGALVVPLVSLFLLTSDKVKAKRTRLVVLIVGIALETGILVGLLWWAFTVQSVAGLGAILDIGLVVVGAALTVLLTFVKGEG